MVDSTRQIVARRAPARVLSLMALSAAGAAAAACLILLGHPVWAGVATLAGAAALIAETLAVEKASPRIVFAARIVDVVFDSALLAPIAWAMRSTDPVVSALALAGLGCSMIAGYVRVRGASLGYETRLGGPSRGIRAGVVGVGLVSGMLLAALCVFVAFCAASVAIAAVSVAKQERGAERGAGLL